MEAYRRLAAVTTAADVDDIRTEWADRYGAPPPPAESLLDAARLRAECARLGIREVAVARDIARIAPLRLKTSQMVRLARRWPKEIYKEDLAQLVFPMSVGGPRASKPDPADLLVSVLQELVPPELAASA
jgi:transcription-repair coupling factor (superfamily II helicase)